MGLVGGSDSKGSRDVGRRREEERKKLAADHHVAVHLGTENGRPVQVAQAPPNEIQLEQLLGWIRRLRRVFELKKKRLQRRSIGASCITLVHFFPLTPHAAISPFKFASFEDLRTCTQFLS